jgi:hypothetical protein
MYNYRTFVLTGTVNTKIQIGDIFAMLFYVLHRSFVKLVLFICLSLITSLQVHAYTVMGVLYGVPSTDNVTVTANEISCYIGDNGYNVTYTCTGLLPYGNYTIEPALSGYSFDPSAYNIYGIRSNIFGVDFTATQD